jgi:hypothetical protein
MLVETGTVRYCHFISEIYISEALNILDQINAPLERKKGLIRIVAS